MNPAYIPAVSALAGAIIGSMTALSTTWLTQRAQFHNAVRQKEREKLEALYSDFIDEAARLYGDALTHQTEDVTNMIRLYALIGHMRVVSARPVISAAEQIEGRILEAYLGPNRSLHDVTETVRQGDSNLLTEFSEACREDLAARAR